MIERDPYANRRVKRVAKSSHPSDVSVRRAAGNRIAVDISGLGRTVKTGVSMVYRVVDNHAGNCFPVFFLFGSVDAVRNWIDRKTMDRVLNMEVL